MRIAVVGARGQLGAAVVEECAPDHRTIGFGRDDLDIADEQAVLDAMTQFNLPLEGAAILLGIDQIMDMGRTAVNVMGNCIATAVVARWEGVFDDTQMRKFTIEKAA